VREVWQHRELAWLLTRREVKVRYNDSSLGLAWSLMRPLAQLLIYYFAIGQVLGVARSIPGFAIFVFIGLTGWTFFTEIVSKGSRSIVDNHGLVKKVYLPREVFPLAATGAACFTLAVQAVILVGAMIALKTLPPVGGLGYVVGGIAILGVFGLALSLIASAVNVYFRDIEHIVEVVLVIAFWLSPIVYSFTFVHNYLHGGPAESLYLSNPVTIAVLAMQRGLWADGIANPAVGAFPENLGELVVIGLVAGLIFLWLAHRVFARLQGNFAQEL
jgi:ABC-2 type transport system permease protein